MAFNDTLSLIQVKLLQAFSGTGRTQTETAPQPVTAARLLEMQTANVSLIMSNDRCVGYQVAYLSGSSVTLPTVSATTVDDTCTIADGTTVDTALESYTPNINIVKTFNINDKDCDTVIKFAERAAEALKLNMHLIAHALNRYLIGRLNANKMTPTFAGENGTIVGDTIEFAAADYTPDLLADWLNIATHHAIPNNHMLLSGQPFLNAYYNAGFHSANDNQRSDILQFSAGNRLSFDTWDMDDVIGAPTTFCVDPNIYAFYSRNVYDTVAREVGDAAGTVEFALPLQYQVIDANGNQVPKTFMYNDGGVMKPIMVDVRYQKNCTVATTNNGRSTLKHVWSLRVEGMFDIAPIANSAGSGILLFAQV